MRNEQIKRIIGAGIYQSAYQWATGWQFGVRFSAGTDFVATTEEAFRSVSQELERK
jgi:hypothetical protein